MPKLSQKSPIGRKKSFANVMIGTAGHIDHGKTQLIKLLTGCDTDRLKEEKERGMSIDLGFAPCRLSTMNKWIGIVDVPGHERFIRNMVAGATGIDIVLLVIAADDGIMPQTKEHIDIINILGIKKGIVAITKIDIVDRNKIEKVKTQVKLLLKNTPLENSPIAAVSSITGEGFDNFYKTLSDVISETKQRNVNGVFRMNIERTFASRGYGVVATGIPVTGMVNKNDYIELLPQKIRVRVRELQQFGESSIQGKAGECVALNLTGIEKTTVERGNTLSTPEYFEPFNLIKARLNIILGYAGCIRNNSRVLFYTGTSETAATITLLEKDRVNAGETTLVQIKLEKSIVISEGDKFIIRTGPPMITAGGGTIIGGLKNKLKRKRKDIIQNILKEENAIKTPVAFIQHIVENSGSYISKPELIRAVKLKERCFNKIIDEMIKKHQIISFDNGSRFILTLKLDEYKKQMANYIEIFHKKNPLATGIDKSTLRNNLNIDTSLFNFIFDCLINSKEIFLDKNKVKMRTHRIKLTSEQQKLKDKITEVYLTTKLKTPRVDELSEKMQIDKQYIEKIINLLFEEGTLIKISEKVILHKNNFEEIKNTMIEYLKNHGELNSSNFKDMIKTSRKYSIAILDYFNGMGLTKREGNIHRLKQDRL